MAMTRRRTWLWSAVLALAVLLGVALAAMRVETVTNTEKRCGMCGRELRRDWYVVRLWGLRVDLPIIGETVGGNDLCPHVWQVYRETY